MRIRKLWQQLLCAFVATAVLCISAWGAAEEAPAKRIVRIACGVNDALYLDENGKPAGCCAYYVQQLAWVNDWTLKYVEGSWTESVQRLYDGEIDLLFPTQRIEDRLGRMGFSDYIGGYQSIALFADADAEIYFDDFEAFNGKRVALSEDTSNAEALEAYAREHGFTYTPVAYRTTQEKVDALQNGDVDLILFSTMNNVPHAKIVCILDYLPFYFCTRIDDTSLLDELNAGMRQILIESPKMATNVFDATLKGDNTLSLTRQEHEIVQSTQKLRVGMYEDSLPLSGFDANGKVVGIYAGLLEAIAQKAGVAIEIVPVPRDEFLYDYLDRGEVNFVISSKNLPYLAKDTSNYVVSESIMDYITVAITKPDYQFEQDDHPVFALTAARRYWEADIFALFPGASVIYEDDAKSCMEAIQSGKADATLLNTWEYNYQSKNPRFAEMLEWENLRRESPLVLGTRRDFDLTLLTIVEKAIDQVSAQDKDAILTTNLNMPYSDYSTADQLYMMRYTLLVGGVVLLALIVFLLMYLHMRRQHVRELETNNELLRQANQAKSSFLSRMSHELRTPLNAITGYTEELRQKLDDHTLEDEQTRETLASIQKASRYQLAIIGDLLDIQKIESGRMELSPTEVDAADYMQSIVAMIRPEADEKNIDFTYERLTNDHELYVLDAVRFQQVLLNLLHNAIKFTPSGGKVHMTAETIAHGDDASELKFVIADNGIGMSEDFQKNSLFQRFAQEYQGNTSPYEGCGTGLALCRDIMRLMGGEIICESEQGVGTTFTVTLTVQHGVKRKKRAARKPTPSYDLSGVRVLLCEDNQMNQDIERRLLERMHCEVQIADDGQIGVDCYRQSDEGYFHVVLMDIRMPNMDGLEAARAIRASGRGDSASLPILAVSANSFEEDVQKSLDAGMNEHLAKPVGAQILYEKIRLYCAAHVKPQEAGAVQG